VQHAWGDVHLDVRHARRHAPVGGEHLGGRRVVLVAPDDAHGRRDPVELLDEIEHARAVAGDAGIVAEPLGSEDRVGAAVAEAHRRGAPIELRQAADVGERVRHVGFARADFLQPRLRALRRAGVLVRQRARHRAPEEVGRGGDIAVRGELVGEVADVLVDPVHGGSEHHRGHLAVGCGHREIAVERSALARANLDGLARHRGPPWLAV